MESLEVTDEQYAFVQQLREEISEQVVGKYGHVREKDAIQFLIDNFDGDIKTSGEDTAEISVDVPEEPSDLEEISYDESEDASVTDSSEEDADESDADGELDADEDTDTDEDGAADDDEMLDEMMSLLETHDDKWEESESGDHRYSVELPDGSTEEVQTKDDVRAILFKNYR